MATTTNKTTKTAKTTAKSAKAKTTKAASSASAKTAKTAKAEQAPKAAASKASAPKNAFESVMSTLSCSTNKIVEQVRDEAAKAENRATKMTADMNARIESAMVEAAVAMRGMTYTAVGMPFALQAAVTAGDLADKALYLNLFEDAKVAGEARVAEVASIVDPYVKQVASRVEPLVGQFEAFLPGQMQDAIAENRDRVRKLVNA